MNKETDKITFKNRAKWWEDEKESGESLFLRKLVLGIPAQASGFLWSRASPIDHSFLRPQCLRAISYILRSMGFLSLK
jgi:hypothetical protein